MKILIEPPTWLGDAVMATPAIEALLEAYPKAEVTLVGSLLSTEALKFHPQVVQSEVLDKGWWALRRKAKALGHVDLAFSFDGLINKAVLTPLISAIGILPVMVRTPTRTDIS
jgi:heptosyltransferase-2